MKQEQTSFAKVTRPIIKGVFPRSRLFDLLDRRRERPVIWVSGPPGCGKTTLVTSYLEARELPCLWYQIDEGDADPATFFYYMGFAAKKAAPRKRKPLPLLTPEYLPGLPTFTLRYFENIYHRLKAPSLVVFDNYQEVPAESPFHELIRHGLSHIPESITVVLISRGEPRSALARMRANQLMEVIGWDELRLTLEESEGIVRLYARETLSQQAIEHLHRATDGWLAGLMLMLKTAERERIDPLELSRMPAEQIFDYFTGEILDKINEETREFLLKTAFLPKMTVQMAEALTGYDSAKRILSRLNRNHCFTKRHFHSKPAYEYHPLFRDFLVSLAEETYPPESLSSLRRDAAMLLEEADQGEAAIALLHDAGDWEGMVRLILKQAPAMLAQGRNRPLEEWLRSLPEDIIESTPWLLYWIGACRLSLDPSLSREYFEQAFKGFENQEDVAGIFLAWSGVAGSIYYAQEDFTLFDYWVDVLEELVERFEAFPSAEIEALVASSMFVALIDRQPQHPEVEVWAERAISAAQEQPTINARIQTLANLVKFQSYLGDFQKVKIILDSLNHLARSRDASPFAQIISRLAAVVHYQTQGEHEKCLQAASEGLEVSRTNGVHLLDHIILGNLAGTALNMGDCATAGKHLDKMASSLGHFKPWDKALYHMLRGREALIQGDHRKADHHAELALKHNNIVGATSTLVWHHLLKAQTTHTLGENRQASEHLARAFNVAHHIKSEYFTFLCLLSEAHFALDQEDEASALTSIRKALELGKEQRYLNSMVDQPSVIMRLCAKALEAEIEVDYAQEIIRKRKLVLDEPPVHLENWPWAVQIFTLGRFELVIDGEPFRSSKKAQKKPLEMLKVLTSFGEGKEVNRDRLSDTLWPQSEGDRAQRAFDTTLHRLRQLLGHDKALTLREGRLTLDARYCWVDSMAFERILGQAENASDNGERDRAIQLFEKAISLYHGPFLAGDTDMPWVISYSERLRSKFLRSIERLGSYLEEASELDKAVECFERAIEVDDLAEVFYQRLMLCLKQLGRRTEAVAVYQRCRKTLTASLGLEPSPETEAIYKSLLS